MADLTVASIPVYLVTMGAEYSVLRKWADDDGVSFGDRPADYTPKDTATSLAMGLGSLVAPLAVPHVVRHVIPGKGRFGKALVGTAIAAAIATTVADRVVDSAEGDDSDHDSVPASGIRRRLSRFARRARRITGPTAVATGTLALSTFVAERTNPRAQWAAAGEGRDLGTGPLAWTAAMAGWDFIYYWNHRLQHEVRAMWAIHVVHHSSERYNLSTALRQPVADALGVFVPYGAMARLGIRPHLITQARAINLLYQYWIHTETVRSLGVGEAVLNTPSHHRVHHGSQPQYLDRNHGSILILWDRLFGTFAREDERVVYGLTKNIGSFHPVTVVVHEYRDIVRDVANSTTWRDRLGFVLRGPGWAYDRHRDMAETSGPATRAAVAAPTGSTSAA